MTGRRALTVVAVTVLAVGGWLATASPAATHAVDIRNFSFAPPEVTVAAGDTVTWTNRDGEAHAVQGGPMSSPDIPPSGSFSFTFDDVGDVSYFCRLHTYMTGVVHVVPAGGATTTTSTTRPPTSTTVAPTTTTTTTAPPASTTSTTSTPGATTTTTTASTTTTSAPSSGGRGFQEVPDDPSATYPPGHPRANDPPPSTAPPPTTTTTTSPRAPRPFQDVPMALAAARGSSLGDGTELAPYETTRDGVKVFRLTMDETAITVAPGVTKQAYAFNGIVPGPVLRVGEGDRVRIVVDNQLPFATGVHWHGMILPNRQDGVPGITQEAIEPGDTFTYEWTAVATGTHWYHSHSSGRHIGKGLYGVLEVVPKIGDIEADRDYRVVLGDTDLGFVLNGRSYPATPRLAAAVGETVRLRVVNAGDQVHAMHLHGTPFEVAAQDGIPRRVPEGMDTLTVSPGQTFDLVATMPSTGAWLFHCHIFGHSHHATDDVHTGDGTGMTGMVMVVDVGPSDAPLDALPLSTGRDISDADAARVALVAIAIAALSTPVLRRRSWFLTPRRKDRA